MADSSCRVKIEIRGIVQGVGFRPFIYKLASKHRLSGFIFNNGSGVVIEVEGRSVAIELFLEDVTLLSPPLSRIDFIGKEKIDSQGSISFEIRESVSNGMSTSIMLPADLSLCKECLEEFNDPQNRRYEYPFINCTNCGPRYTIIKNLPYDRKNTSMNKFVMCKECKEEYNNPNNRRYHAEPISCYKCGPKLQLLEPNGTVQVNEKEAFTSLCDLIRSGEIVAIKGLGGFHIVCDARNEKSVSLLRLKKHRPSKPLAVMFQNISAIKSVASLTLEDEKLILSQERPIVIVQKKLNSSLADSIAPNIDRIGVFLPYTPLHALLLKNLDFPIVATSANISDEPMIRDAKELLNKLPFVIHSVLTHDREIINACDDSVVQDVNASLVMLRMARGFAPQSFFMQNKSKKKILALGANQKATIALAFNNNIVLSPHIGDLNSIGAVEYFSRTVETLKRVYNFEPEIIVCDKHPKYETTLWAKEYIKNHTGVELLQVQHHYAHALACMAEYSLDEKVLAFCFDGTGYGDDASIWGGEVFVADKVNYKRVYHFKNFALLGGEKAVREPRRVALSLLFEYFTLDEIFMMKSELITSFKKSELKTFYQMHQREINSPKCSSVGRLFDAVYALSGHLKMLAYEGEGGLVLESLSALSKSKEVYSYSFQGSVIEYQEMICQILQESNKAEIAKKFINTITKIIIDITMKYPDLPVVLSGGVFQNKLLVSQVIEELKIRKRKYFIQSKTPVNDGGISLGQVYHAI
ncbi:carbamoyltransferase HypF [Sulfurimonas sp.]|uniref:carbamoyltransferase HypF n=1 Tax=Sulfurimonas sp. TaxID=2022749 RepID=UPI0026270AFB|nr:carbamoyltransferase HypF [Sulfurimonas sp.]